MKIILNLHGFSPGCGGAETYLSNLVKALQQVGSDDKFLLCMDQRFDSLLAPGHCNFTCNIKNYSGLGWYGLGRVLGQIILRRDLLAKHLSSFSADVIHHPLTILNPPGLPVPAVLTFHDMQQEFYPEFFSPRELRRRHDQYRASVKEARAIIAISHHVKDCLVERYGADPERVHVIYHGLDPQFRPIIDPTARMETFHKFSLDRPFIIYPAATWPHKNHIRLLKALRCLLDQGRFDGELLLTGSVMQGENNVRQAIENLRLQKHVRRLGYVPRQDLPHLLSLARMLIFPSLFEGFGLPVIEAMACGCPVVCAHTSALPEVAGDAAFYFDPVSIDEMAKVIDFVWHDESGRHASIQRGLTRASEFDWQRAAEQTLSVYRRAICQ